MEFEQLENGRKCIETCIATQDVGDYYNMLHPRAVLVSHFRYPPAPLTVADTIPLLARHARRVSPAASAASAPTASAAKAAVPRSSQTARLSCANKSAAAIADPHEGVPYADRVDVVEGPLLLTERLYRVLAWLSRCPHIADTTTELEARKVILQESEVLPPPSAPRSEAERYAAMGRQHTERNQRLSRLIITWGHADLLLREECYFDEGLIVTVQRRMLTPREMLTYAGLGDYQPAQVQSLLEAMAEARRSFYATRVSRIDAFEHATMPLLDFTFCAVPEPLQLLRLRPVAGQKHVRRDVQPVEKTHYAQGVFLNQQTDPTRPQKEQRVIVKARNKQGDEEVYEFVENTRSRYGFLHNRNPNAESALDALAEKLESTYAATSVRISSCGMESTDKLVPVLRRLVVNAIMTIHSLDLSDNRISTLPDFSLLPLQRLQLHQNRISDWEQVENRVCTLPLLSALTLHGNPLAETDPNYWQSALARLMRHPNRATQLRQLDHVTLTAQDYNMAATFEMFQTGNTKLLEAAKKATGKKKTTGRTRIVH